MISRTRLMISGTTLLAASLLQAPAFAGDVAIGSSKQNGMDIGAVYIQPVTMEPHLPGMHQPSDIHIEADIHATKDNQQGFSEGDWIPYLTISYTISKVGSDWQRTGTLMPMSASDGPHYATNLKVNGPGKYKLTYNILPPPYAGMHRHTDRETGVAQWWDPINLSWEFAYVGVGKKGGY